MFETPTEVTGGAVIFEKDQNHYILFTSEVTDKLCINPDDPVQLDFTKGGLSIYKRKDGNRTVKKDGPDRVVWLIDSNNIKPFQDYIDRWIETCTSEGHVVFKKPLPMAKRLVNTKYRSRLKKKIDRLQGEREPVRVKGKKRVPRPESRPVVEPVNPRGAMPKDKIDHRLKMAQAPVVVRTRLKKSNHTGKYQPILMFRIHQQVCEMLNMVRGDRVKVVWDQSQITLLRSEDFGYSLFAPYWNANRRFNSLAIEISSPVKEVSNWASIPTTPVENLRLSSKYIRFYIPQVLLDKMEQLPTREFGVRKPSKKLETV